MSALTAHRSLAGRLRTELYQNICLLSLRRPMLEELARLLSGGPHSLDKLNQTLLIHLSYYFSTIIDPKLAQLISWPLYDKASERTYKTQLMGFLSLFYVKNGSTDKDRWITPIQSSYLSAGGFKVMQLLFEMSQLALSRLLRNDFKLTQEKLEACDQSRFLNDKVKLDTAVAKSRKCFTEKSINFVAYKKKAETVSAIYKELIKDLETENESVKKTLENIAGNFEVSDELKDVTSESIFLTEWNDFSDYKLSQLELKWSQKTKNVIKIAADCRRAGKLTVARNSHIDKSSYIIEYNPTRDSIKTAELEELLSSQQRFVLKNIVKNDVLNFGYLLQGYAVAVSFVFKNVRQLDQILPCSDVEELETGYKMLAGKGKHLIDGLHKLEMKLKETTSPSSYSEDSVTEVSIPPLPDLKIRDEAWQPHAPAPRFTPLQPSKIQFSITNRTNPEFRQPKSLFLAPTRAVSRPSIFRNIAKLQTENLLTAFNNNLSSASSNSSQPKELNRTTADCSAGFTKDQVLRLLSSRKSSSKKLKVKPQGSHSKAKRGALFRDTPENSFALARSVSSPNLMIPSETKKKFSNIKIRNLYAIAQEESPDRISEMSGVACLQTSTNSIPQNISLERQEEFKSMPIITLSKPDVSKDSSIISNNSTEQNDEDANFETPKNNATTENNNSKSLEKLIEKYKRFHSKTKSKLEYESPKLITINDCSINKQNNSKEINIDTNLTTQLPDLVSPSVNNFVSKSSVDHSVWQLMDTPPGKEKAKCRESLGTMLGVDKSFLDQFDLIE